MASAQVGVYRAYCLFSLCPYDHWPGARYCKSLENFEIARDFDLSRDGFDSNLVDSGELFFTVAPSILPVERIRISQSFISEQVFRGKKKMTTTIRAVRYLTKFLPK